APEPSGTPASRRSRRQAEVPHPQVQGGTLRRLIGEGSLAREFARDSTVGKVDRNWRKRIELAPAPTPGSTWRSPLPLLRAMLECPATLWRYFLLGDR